MGFAIHQPWIEGESLPLSASASLHQLFNSFCIHTYSRYSRSSYLSWMSLQTQLLGYPLFNERARSGCFSWQSHLGASWLLSCTKILLTVRMRPAAIALIKRQNIRDDVRQKLIIDEKSQFSVGRAWASPNKHIDNYPFSPQVWGSLRLAPII